MAIMLVGLLQAVVTIKKLQILIILAIIVK